KQIITYNQKKAAGKLIIGTTPSFAKFELLNILQYFSDLFPKIELHIETHFSYKLTKMLDQEKIHVGIIRGEHYWEGEKIHIKKEPIVAANKSFFNMEDLPYLSQVKYNFRDKQLKKDIDRSWGFHFKNNPKVMIEVDAVDTCMDMIKSGGGYGIIPSISIKKEDGLYN